MVQQTMNNKDAAIICVALVASSIMGNLMTSASMVEHSFNSTTKDMQIGVEDNGVFLQRGLSLDGQMELDEVPGYTKEQDMTGGSGNVLDEYTDKTPFECAGECDATNGCVGFAYTRKKKQCKLKSAFVNQKSNTGKDTYKKVTPMPSPSPTQAMLNSDLVFPLPLDYQSQIQKAKVPTCTEELLVRHKALRMLSTTKSQEDSEVLWTSIGASESKSSNYSGYWDKRTEPIVLGPALIRLVFHDFIDRNNLENTDHTGGFDACLHAPRKAVEGEPDTDLLEDTHNSGLSKVLNMVRILALDTSLSLPDAIMIASAAFLEGSASLTAKVGMVFGRPDVTCNGGNKFSKGATGDIHLQDSPSKFAEPQKNIDFFKNVSKLDEREMVALYGAHTLGGLNNGVIPYGSMGGPRSAVFCANESQGGKHITQEQKDSTFLTENRGVNSSSPFTDVWFDETPGTFDTLYFEQMLSEWDAYSYDAPYEIGDLWANHQDMNKTWKGPHEISWDENWNEVYGEGKMYPAPNFPRCGQSRGTLLGEANKACKVEGITQEELDTTPYICRHWSQACDAGKWCRHIPGVNPPNQANVKSLMQWTTYGGGDGRVVTLPSDWALLMMDDTRKYIREFTNNASAFHQAFAEVFAKMANEGYTDLLQCSEVDCTIEAQTLSCGGLTLTSCALQLDGLDGCKLVGAFGDKGEVTCSSQSAPFLCDMEESSEWDLFF